MHSIFDRNSAAAFAEEVRLMKKLRPHQNVVLFLGVTLDPICIVTEYMLGGSLESLLKNDHMTFSIPALKRITAGIAAGMFHLHSENIVHRDLAARNVLVGEADTVKVSDFGMR
jgi:serine/threonine protein kinase